MPWCEANLAFFTPLPETTMTENEKALQKPVPKAGMGFFVIGDRSVSAKRLKEQVKRNGDRFLGEMCSKA